MRADSEPPPLSGLRVVCFESRRQAEASRLIARAGGEPIEAPSVREVPVAGPSVGPLDAALAGDAPLLLVLLTGVGTDLLIQALSQLRSRESVLELLVRPNVTLVCRGPKPYAVLKACGIKPALVVGEPNTWRDLLRELDGGELVRGRIVYVQEYGRTNQELMAGLAERAPSGLFQIKTYGWALPEDLAPLRAGIGRIAAGEAEVALFTSGVQITHLFQVAEQLGQSDGLRSGLAQLVVASVGPLTSEALRAVGVVPDIEPVHPKLGHLMLALGADGPAKLRAKRSTS